MRLLTKALSITLLLCPLAANAVLVPAVGPVLVFTGMALKDILDLGKSYHSVVETPVMTAITSSFGNIQNSIVQRDMMISQSIRESAILATINAAEADRIQTNLMASHQLALENDIKMGKQRLYSDDGIKGGPSERYFRALCNDNKAKKMAFGTAGYLQQKDKRVNELVKSETEANKTKDSRIVERDLQLNHYSKYCSEEGKSQGLCDEVAEIPHADLLSIVALNPQNKDGAGYISGLNYHTEYTYSDFEHNAAKDFYKNITRMGVLRKPTLTEKEANPFIWARYSQLQAGLSLARYSFTSSMANRVAMTETEGAKLSRLDQIGYMLQKSQRDTLEQGGTATAKAKKMAVMNQIALSNYITFEKDQYQERINNLVSATIAIKSSNLSRVEALNNNR